MEKITPRFRCSIALAACLALLILTGVSSGVTYAATGGQTANPIEGVKIFLNGEELGTYDYTENEDGSYTIQMNNNDVNELTVKNSDEDLDITVRSIDEMDLENCSVTCTPYNGDYQITVESERLKIQAAANAEAEDIPEATAEAESSELPEAKMSESRAEK